MKRSMLLLCLYSSLVYSYTYQLTIEPEGTNPIEVAFMKIWTTIDFLKAINVNHQEKVAFLHQVVDDTFALYNLIVQKKVNVIAEKSAWQELCMLLTQSFEELYGMLSVDEIGFFRVIMTRIGKLLIADHHIKGE